MEIVGSCLNKRRASIVLEHIQNGASVSSTMFLFNIGWDNFAPSPNMEELWETALRAVRTGEIEEVAAFSTREKTNDEVNHVFAWKSDLYNEATGVSEEDVCGCNLRTGFEQRL